MIRLRPGLFGGMGILPVVGLQGRVLNGHWPPWTGKMPVPPKTARPTFLLHNVTINAMLPSMKQRLFIAAAIAIGATFCLMASRTLIAADHSSGLTLTNAHAGLFLAVLVTLLLALPAILAGLVVSVTGNPLAGVFTTAMSLLILAANGGPIDGWLRNITGPAAYRSLAFEMILWSIGLAGVIAIIRQFRPKLRRDALQSNAVKTLITSNEDGHMASLSLPTARGFAAGAAAACVGGIIALILIRSSDSGQVIGSLLVAFTIAGVCGQMLLPRQSSPVAILFAPAAVAIVAYLIVASSYTSHDQLLQAWFAQTNISVGVSDRLLSLALALPIHYIAAGVGGAAMGIGLGQNIQTAQLEFGEEPQAA